MNISSLPLCLAVAALLAVASSSIAQSPQAAKPAPPASEEHEDHDHEHHLPPTNLKVLPKTMTGEQVHELMEGWEAALGAHCNTCHTADPKKLGPNGRPRLNFADDSKQEKSTARLMYKMMQDINDNYVSMVDSSAEKVGCGTCHRGHLDPEPFVAPKENHEAPHAHQGSAPHDDDHTGK